MSKVFCAHAVSVDGYISGRTPGGEEEFGCGLGDASVLFDWYMNGDTPSQVFDEFKLSAPSARFFDAIAARVGAVVSGHVTYEHSAHWGGGGPTRQRHCSSSATGARPRSARRRPWSPPASRTPSPRPARSRATRTSP